MSLKEKYQKDVIPVMKERFGYVNNLAVPRIEKATLNVGIGAKLEDKVSETVRETLRRITGQQPVATKARKSIAGFKIREGMTLGFKVVLRGKRMYDFVEKMVKVTLPRVRDFRGLAPKMVDRQGNLTVGFHEHLPFPEVNPDEVDRLHGFEVAITTSAKTREEGLELFRLLGFPFKEDSSLTQKL